MDYNKATMNAIYEVYNVNHVKCEVDDCCANCAENFKIIKESKQYTGFRIINSNDWINFCMNNKNHIINNIIPIEYNSSITKNTFLYDNGIIQPSLDFIRFLFNKNHPDLIYYVKKFLEFKKTSFCDDIIRQIRTIDVLKLIIDNNIYTYDWLLTLDLNNYPTLSKLLIIYDANIILFTCSPVNQVTEDDTVTEKDTVTEDDTVTEKDIVIEDDTVTEKDEDSEEDDTVTEKDEDSEEDSEENDRLIEDIYNQKNSFSSDYLELNCVIM